jgi:hypothetical protein
VSDARPRYPRACARGLALLVGTASLLAGCATPDFGPIDESWFACARNRQCTIAEDPTCALVPINKDYAKSFALQVRLNRPREIATGPCPTSIVRYAAVCDAGRCASDARGLVRRRLKRQPPAPVRSTDSLEAAR